MTKLILTVSTATNCINCKRVFPSDSWAFLFIFGTCALLCFWQVVALINEHAVDDCNVYGSCHLPVVWKRPLQ